MYYKRKYLLVTAAAVMLMLLYLKQRGSNNNTVNMSGERFESLYVTRPAECERGIVWLVHSKLTNFESRNAMREAYSKEELDELGVTRIFVLGVDASYYEYLNVGKSEGKAVRDAHESNDNANPDGNASSNRSNSVDGDGDSKNKKKTSNNDDITSMSNFDINTYSNRRGSQKNEKKRNSESNSTFASFSNTNNSSTISDFGINTDLNQRDSLENLKKRNSESNSTFASFSNTNNSSSISDFGINTDLNQHGSLENLKKRNSNSNSNFSSTTNTNNNNRITNNSDTYTNPNFDTNIYSNQHGTVKNLKKRNSNSNSNFSSTTNTNSNNRITNNSDTYTNPNTNNVKSATINNNSTTNTKTNIDTTSNKNINTTNITNPNINSSIQTKKRRHINITPTPRTQSLITNEQEKFGDLLQADFLDTYRNLTLKHITGLNYTITHCPRVSYILKSDDDIIVDIPRVLRMIKNTVDSANSNDDSNVNFITTTESGGQSNVYANTGTDTNVNDNINNTPDFSTNKSTVQPDPKRSSKSESVTLTATTLNKPSPLNIFGFVLRNKSVERNPASKWFVTVEEYNRNYFPNFASGWFYFTTEPAVRLLLESYVKYTSSNKEFWIDDVFVTGVLRDGTGVGVVDLNEMYAVDYRYLACCIKDSSRNLLCDYAVGPDGGKKSLHREFKRFLEFCRHSCAHRGQENSVRNTCIVAYAREEKIGRGKPVIESLGR